MKAQDAINATATLLSRMSPQDRAAVARVITMPGKIESITRDAIYSDVKAIATRSVKHELKDGVLDHFGEMMDAIKGW